MKLKSLTNSFLNFFNFAKFFKRLRLKKTTSKTIDVNDLPENSVFMTPDGMRWGKRNSNVIRVKDSKSYKKKKRRQANFNRQYNYNHA